MRAFFGGSARPDLAAAPEAELRQLAQQQLGDLLGLRGEPKFAHIFRWQQAMPQYHLGHLERVAAIEREVQALPGLALAGNAYRGVGVPHCIHSGEQAAEAIAAQLAAPQE